MVAFDAFQRVERVHHFDCSSLERLKNCALFRVVLFVRRIPFLRSVDHKSDSQLTQDVWAEGDGSQLVQLRDNFGIDVVGLEISASLSTLSDHTLGRTVHGQQFDVFHGFGVFLGEIHHDLLERNERLVRHVDVLLIHLICHDDERVLDAELDDFSHISIAQTLTSGVSWVDDDHGSWFDTVLFGLVQRSLQLRHLQRPVGRLIQKVLHSASSVQRQSSRVEGILRDRNHNAVTFVSDHQSDDIVYSRAGSIGEKNVVRVSRIAITLADVFCDLFSHHIDTLRVTVSTNAVMC